MPLILPITIPPITAAMAPKLQERANTPLTLTPIESAACWSLAVARMATPVRENLKITMKTTVVISANMNPHRSPEGTTANPRFRGLGGNMGGKVRYVGSQIIYMRPLRIAPRPMVTMMTEMTGSPIIGLKMRGSITIPRMTAKTIVMIKAI